MDGLQNVCVQQPSEDLNGHPAHARQSLSSFSSAMSLPAKYVHTPKNEPRVNVSSAVIIAKKKFKELIRSSSYYTIPYKTCEVEIIFVL